MQKATLIPVTFHGEQVELVEFEGQPYVAIKRIVGNLGLDWPTQYVKLTEKFGPTVGVSPTVEPDSTGKSLPVLVEIPTTGADGKQRLMICLAFYKLAAWLNSISPNKVAQHLRAKVRMYQAECDRALWDYWTKGVAINPRMAQSTLTVHEALAISRECVRLQEKVAECTSAVLARELYKHLVRQTAALGDTVAPLDQLAPIVRQHTLALESQGGAA